MIETAHAKLNLTLDITGKRADGYHKIISLLHEISLSDTVEINDAEGIRVSCSPCAGLNVPQGEANICHAAVIAFRKATGIDRGASVDIKKAVPLGAGLGGGSSDAAATLRALNILWDAGLTEEELESTAVSVGADVPFFIRGGTALVKGRGDVFQRLDCFPELNFVVLYHGKGTSTGSAYSALDYGKTGKAASTERLLVSGSSPEKIASGLHNDFMFSGSTDQERTCTMMKDLIREGALRASLTGSGSAVFGIFREKREAERAANALAGKYCFSVSSRSCIR